ncbi:MAG TPA: hypothetical protein VGA56_19460 [Opitutaceae bacterium]
MNDNEFEGLPDNDWDDTWDFAWSEFEWEKHLREQDKVLHTYLSHYDKLTERSDRIDEVAHLMGWDQEEWTSEEVDVENPDEEPEGAFEPFTETDHPEADRAVDPYTIHKHPVYVSTRALFLWLQRSWEFVAPACGSRMPVRVSVAFATALARAEHNSVLATQALDMGDFSLAVSQVKRAMAELNLALRQLQSLDDGLHPAFAQFRHQALIRLFDIREIWLRVMRDCREELDRRVSEGEN